MPPITATPIVLLPRGPGKDDKGKNPVDGYSRPNLDKWSSNTWPICASVPCTYCKAPGMGGTDRLEKKLGKPPPWGPWA